MTGSLAAFQSGLGLSLRGEGPCPIDADSAGFRFTAGVRRSWCEGRAMIAARAVLTFLPDSERRRLVGLYVDGGGGLAAFTEPERDAFLAFLAPRLPDPSHALCLCRMEQALAQARRGVARFVGGDACGRVGQGAHAALVWFHADPGAVLLAMNGGPIPPVGAPDHPVVFAPGLPDLFRIATREEAALWTRLPATDVAPDLVSRLLTEGVLTRV